MSEKVKGKDAGGEIVKIAEGNLYNKIYTIRGQKVMLDFDLAKIYGYSTSAFNRQVKRNIEKFEGEDFMFRLTRDESKEFVMCHFGTSRKTGYFTGQDGGTRKLPYAFTEQGIYMLMTVLRGELAVKQSRTLIRLFKSMKDYYMEGGSIISKIVDNTNDIAKIKTEIKEINSEMEDMVKKSEISPIFLDFNKFSEIKEYLLLDGELIKAKEAYMDIYKYAKKKIYIIDNYVNIKTLHLLQLAKRNLEIIFFTDNSRKLLRKSDAEDFNIERPDLKITFIKTNRKIHDRFIVLDELMVYQAGSSSKDAGIHEITDEFVKRSLLDEVEKLKKNGVLVLR